MTCVCTDCGKHYDVGNCTNTTGNGREMYYWSPTDKTCAATFNFSGCGGNDNKFHSESECRTACDPVCNRTSVPSDHGHLYCKEGSWYDWNIDKCRPMGCA